MVGAGDNSDVAREFISRGHKNFSREEPGVDFSFSVGWSLDVRSHLDQTETQPLGKQIGAIVRQLEFWDFVLVRVASRL